MKFPSLGEFAQYLEAVGELHRVRIEVDPNLELTEIATRALREGKPALLFERVKGSRFPLAMNLYASDRRIELALGRPSQEIGARLVSFLEEVVPPSLKTLWNNRRMLQRLFLSRTRRVYGALSQQVVGKVSFNDLPIQTCWPGDGGRFITLGQVVSYDPKTGKRNTGIYRMQIYDERTSGMHWQIQKGGGFHYHQAEQMGRDLEVAVALGTDPAYLLATIAALPEGIDEALFAAFLRGTPTKFARGKSTAIDVPANAEFVLEGIVRGGERRIEGPFGDHFGHYSTAAPFPVFEMKSITHRRNAIYPATVVGIPPMEDKFLGDATQHMLGPLARLLHHEVKDVWAYYEAGFHNLLVVSVQERYHKEALKAALGLLGTGQLSLTKCLILVSEDVDVRDWRSVLRAVRENFDSATDLVLIPGVAIDTLDFTSGAFELGSRMVLDATHKTNPVRKPPEKTMAAKDIRQIDHRISDGRDWEGSLLVVQGKRNGRTVLESLLKRKEVQHFPLIGVVSDDIDVHDQVQVIWGIFSRFDCALDVTFARRQVRGIATRFSGPMGIDATWKNGYPEPLQMDDEIVKRVDARWEEYWR